METEAGSEFISPLQLRHVMRYVNACKYLQPGWRVLDAACGTGYGTRLIYQHTGHHTVGIDSDADALDYARKHYSNPYIEFKIGDLLMPLNYVQLFDAAVSIETIEHFDINNIPKYLFNVKQTLKPNGLFIVTSPYCMQSGASPITKQHLHEFSLTDLESTLVASGFIVREIHLQRHLGKAGRLGYCMAICGVV